MRAMCLALAILVVPAFADDVPLPEATGRETKGSLGYIADVFATKEAAYRVQHVQIREVRWPFAIEKQDYLRLKECRDGAPLKFRLVPFGEGGRWIRWKVVNLTVE